ncbi:MAG TPA: hypothetical protein VMD05_10230 [Candidatus Nanoarchaeia archaeon]|nr:hypothetical protein [Candidatus Nanoarchaeia archaeon]
MTTDEYADFCLMFMGCSLVKGQGQAATFQQFRLRIGLGISKKTRLVVIRSNTRCIPSMRIALNLPMPGDVICKSPFFSTHAGDFRIAAPFYQQKINARKSAGTAERRFSTNRLPIVPAYDLQKAVSLVPLNAGTA